MKKHASWASRVIRSTSMGGWIVKMKTMTIINLKIYSSNKEGDSKSRRIVAKYPMLHLR